MKPLKQFGRLATIKGDAPNRPVKPPPATRYSGRPDTALGRPTLFPQGPKLLGLGIRRGQLGIGAQPPDFPGTLPEWVWYYVSFRMFDDDGDPRQPPFTGARDGTTWWFQVPEMPGAPRQVGSSISDFVYALGTGFLIVRINGFYWHTAAPPAQQARDAYLETHAQNEGTRVESVEDAEFMGDPTGGTAGRLLAEILAGRSFVGAVHGGIAVPPRYARFV